MTSTTDLSQLIGDTGLDSATAKAMQLTLTTDTLGPAIMAGLGEVQLDDIETSEVLLFTMLIDDSASISYANNEQIVRSGHNLVVDALRGAKQSASVLMSCRYLNIDNRATTRGVLYPYVMLDDAVKLDNSNYNPQGSTPLYDMTAATLTTVAAKMAEFEQGGVSARAVTIIVTDGADNHGTNVPPLLCDMVTGMLRSEQHIIAGMGIDDGSGYGVDFRQIFRDMGIRDKWILTPGDSATDIRRAFQVVSQSAVRASQAANFSQAAIGGGFGG